MKRCFVNFFTIYDLWKYYLNDLDLKDIYIFLNARTKINEFTLLCNKPLFINQTK